MVPVQFFVIAMKSFQIWNHALLKTRTRTLWHQYLKFIIGHVQLICSTNDRIRSKLDCLPTPGPGAHSPYSIFFYSRLHSLFPSDACTSNRQYAAKISFQTVWKSRWFLILSEMLLWKKGFCQVMLWSRISCNSQISFTVCYSCLLGHILDDIRLWLHIYQQHWLKKGNELENQG